MKKRENYDPSEPPECQPYYILWAAKWDMEYQRNLLLYFIHSRGLDGEFEKFYDENYGEEEE